MDQVQVYEPVLPDDPISRELGRLYARWQTKQIKNSNKGPASRDSREQKADFSSCFVLDSKDLVFRYEPTPVSAAIADTAILSAATTAVQQHQASEPVFKPTVEDVD